MVKGPRLRDRVHLGSLTTVVAEHVEAVDRDELLRRIETFVVGYLWEEPVFRSWVLSLPVSERTVHAAARYILQPDVATGDTMPDGQGVIGALLAQPPRSLPVTVWTLGSAVRVDTDHGIGDAAVLNPWRLHLAGGPAPRKSLQRSRPFPVARVLWHAMRRHRGTTFGTVLDAAGRCTSAAGSRVGGLALERRPRRTPASGR